MYTVMLVSDKSRALSNFDAFDRWEELGYTRPLLLGSAAEAITALNTRTVHAVGVDVPPGESAALYDRLHGMSMFYIEPVTEPEALAAVLERMSRMIASRQASSVSNVQTPLMRETFFQTLLDGLMHSMSVMRNRLNLLNLPDAADWPCIIVTLRMVDGDEYLREVWRYGRARLTMALRKFLQCQGEDDQSYGCEGGAALPIAYTLSGLRAGAMRLLACPLVSMDIDKLRSHVMEYTQRQIARVEEFLNLELAIDAVDELDGLKALLHVNAPANASAAPHD